MVLILQFNFRSRNNIQWFVIWYIKINMYWIVHSIRYKIIYDIFKQHRHKKLVWPWFHMISLQMKIKLNSAIDFTNEH